MVDASAPRERAFSFGPFRLFPARQLLLEGERPVRLGNRSLEVLTALVERPGEVITKADLMARVWPGIFVKEGISRVQIAALRRRSAKVGPVIATSRALSGRGYRFVAPVAPIEPATVAHTSTVGRMHNLPPSVIRIIGRAGILGAFLGASATAPVHFRRWTRWHRQDDRCARCGPRPVPAYDHGDLVRRLAPLGDPSLVPSSSASVLGLTIRSPDVIDGIDDTISGISGC